MGEGTGDEKVNKRYESERQINYKTENEIKGTGIHCDLLGWETGEVAKSGDC